MPRLILPLGLCFAAIAPSSAIAQMNPGDPHVPGAVACNDSPTPGSGLPTRIALSFYTRPSTSCRPVP
jgi:hypothetical protein